MNITFLIGNGFDLRLGMHTRFLDMYEGYTAQESASNAISAFKALLNSDGPDYKTWGDFEMAMARNAKSFDDEATFVECLRDFKLYMSTHLEREQNEFKQRMHTTSRSMSICADEMLNSIRNFYTELIPNVINEFISLGVLEHPHYHFVSFNYTDVFDELWKCIEGNIITSDIIHIHGKLDAEVVLGADNLEQVGELPYRVTKKFERAFIKPWFNQSYDSARVEKAETTIEKSNIICIYGMSLGKSDYSWMVRLKNWLLANKNHHLVYFTHSNVAFNKLNWDAMIDEEENRIATLLARICDSTEEMDKVFNQIHIPVGYDIFCFDKILQAEQQRVDEEAAKKAELRKRLATRPSENGV